MSIDTPRVRRLLKYAKSYAETGKLSDSALNWRERSLVRKAVRSGDAAAYIRNQCRRPDPSLGLLARIASLETWKHSLAKTARMLGIAKSFSSQLLDRAKRLTQGTYEASRNEPSVTFATIWVGRFVRFAAIDFHHVPAPSAKPGELTPDLVSASLERHALPDFEKQLGEIYNACAHTSLAGLAARSVCAHQIRSFRRFLRLVPPPAESGMLRCALLELVMPSSRQTRMESAVVKVITRVVGAHSLSIVRQDFSKSLIHMMASIPSASLSTGFFPDIKHTVLPSLRSIRAGVSSYRRTLPDIPHYGSKPRREIRAKSKGRLYPKDGKSTKMAPLLPRFDIRKFYSDGGDSIDTTDSWQSLFAAVTSGEFCASVAEAGTGQFGKAFKLEGGVYSLIPWLTDPSQVRLDLLANARGDFVKECHGCGLALLHFNPEFIVENDGDALRPLIAKWSEQFAEGLDAALQDNPLQGGCEKHRNEFAYRFAQALLIEHLYQVRAEFLRAMRPEFSRLLSWPAASADNSLLRPFWPSSIRYSKERLVSDFQAHLELNQDTVGRPIFVSMDSDFGERDGTSVNLHQYLSQGPEEESEEIADEFRVRLSRGEPSLNGATGTEAATHIAQMLQETGKDYAHFIGLLPKQMAREVSRAISG